MKSSGLAAVLSFFIPGLGQIYNGQILKGLIVMGVQLINALLTIILIGFFMAFVVWVWSIYDAYQEAERINERYGGGPRVY